MRWGARLLLLLGYTLCGGACSGGYPLPPTRCDEFCDATKGFECEDFYQPATCVSSCEEAHTDTEACHAEFDVVVSCFRSHPEAVSAQCDFSSINRVRPCQAEETLFGGCVSSGYLPNIRE